MKKGLTKEQKKARFKKILKYTGVGLVGVGIGYLFFKFMKEDSTDVLVTSQEQYDKDLNDAYNKGSHDDLWGIIKWTQEHGKSVIATTSSKSSDASDEEHWLVAELLDTEPTDCCNVHGNVSDVFVVDEKLEN